MSNVGNKSKQGVVLTEEEKLLLFGMDAFDPNKSKGNPDDSQGSSHLSPSGSANGVKLRRR